MSKKLIAIAITLIPSFAFAHPGHTEGFIAAFAHPFTGIDHLLMMLCVGIFAGRTGGNASWQLPFAFLGAMAAGWLLAANGFVVAGIEGGIAAGLIALGVLFVWKIALPFILQVGMVSGFALLHGIAHGSELSAANPLATLVGFILATALLHGAGLVFAMLLPRENRTIYGALGGFLTLAGGGLLAMV
jgi:urease accessory protein